MRTMYVTITYDVRMSTSGSKTVVRKVKAKSVPRIPLSRVRVLVRPWLWRMRRALSTRELSREPGFEVMSLYNHMANKDEMLDGMVELVSSMIEALRTATFAPNTILARSPRPSSRRARAVKRY